MPKAKTQKFYAVKRGRQGARLYSTWDEAKANVSRFPGAVHKSFKDLSAAQDWLNSGATVLAHAQAVQSSDMSDSGWRQSEAIVISSDSEASESNSENTRTSPQVAGNQPQEPTIVLSPEQRDVLDMVKRGKSVFFTGSAGTGKSVLLREIIKCCGNLGSHGLAVTAATGIAAVNIGGCTLHSWAGIGLGKESAEKLAGRLLGQDKNQRKKDAEKRPWATDTGDEAASQVVKRWRKVKTLIIDEISMIDGVLFDKLEYIARVIRRNSLPFGGIQLVLSGDFCQLPPVPDRVNDVQVKITFAFDAATWDDCVGPPKVLKRVFRQKDQAFVDMLNEMRFGSLNPKTIEAFQNLSRPVVYDDDIEPTELYAKRAEVDRANILRLNKIQREAHTYNALDRPGFDENDNPISERRMETLLERLVAPKSIVLKEGAQVMLIKNLIQGKLVNGSVGRVIGFRRPREALQLGLDLAMQGKLMQPGTDEKIPDEILDRDGTWPVVQFQGEHTVMLAPEEFEVNNAEGKVEAMRSQVPLILAWALSIHKSQGQTLERVRVNLGSVFEKGQAYVALSRATSMDGLQVLRFDAAKVMAHERVLEWNREVLGQRQPTLASGNANDDVMDIDDTMEFWSDLMN